VEVLAGGCRGADIADLDLAVGDDHAVNEQLDELAFLLAGRLGEAGLHASAEAFHLRGTTRKGDRWLRQALIEAAQGAMRTNETYLRAQGERLTRRRGKKRAVVAVAHTIDHGLPHAAPSPALPGPGKQLL